MSQARIALLADRGLVSVRGSDAAKLLQGLVTNDMERLDARAEGGLPPAMYAGLLTPQGKVMFDFFVVRLLERGYELGTTFMLETARDRVAELVKRLRMYKLRSDVTIEDISADFHVMAMWGAPAHELRAIPPVGFDMSPLHNEDPRSAGLGFRWYDWRNMHERVLAGILDAGKAAEADAAEYHAHRIALGVPEGGKDWDYGDAFPHEANLDLLGGISFDKGCYVGQEIVSRMQHRGTVRKRVARVTGAAELSAGRPEIKAGDVVIGRLGSVAGRQGLALLRLDRAIETIDKGGEIAADGIALEIDPETIARHRAAMADRVGQS